ncbi:dolichyl-phosphate-mannose-protein mannosyltransferase [Thermococcus onnurineus NA1]|uniref:Dolichyl-phosphate-mannose-protein mannosyltransferase n=1 Tax=Thermococcus onnurineus (strain NA1) TaxID=523850 RepID=B6YVI5_THEON|nr:glycosyltransferase family 39 protein [Thermococcus onnurineus]ACJ17309.1 dolichyl-phosphate-mannose-protein mannosyltransferase [Thermococcus onnurineus NA1]
MGKDTGVHLGGLAHKVSTNTLIFPSIFILALLVRIRDLNRPFTEYFRYINCQYAVYAKNYVWYGYLNTKLGLISTPYYVYNGGYEYYFHHPPLISIWVSLFFRLFGITEASVRLAEIVLSLVTLVMVYKISKRLWGDTVAYVSSLIFALLPMTAYYDRIVAPDYSAIPFVLLTLYFYILWSEHPKSRYLVYMGLSLFVGTWFDWQAYIIVLGIGIHAVLSDRPDKHRVLVVLFGTALLAFASYLLFVFMVGGREQIVELYHGFLTRTGIKVYHGFDRPGARYTFTILQFLVLELKRALNLFTSIILLFTVFWAGYYVIRRPVRDGYILPLFFHGLVSIFVFKQGAWIHDFWLYQLVPAMVLSSGRGIVLFAELPNRWVSVSKGIHLSLVSLGLLFVTLIESVFTLEILAVVYKVRIDYVVEFVVVLVWFVLTFVTWIALSLPDKERLLDTESLKVSFAIFVPIYLLFGYSKNLIYPYVPKYGILLVIGVLLMMGLFWLGIRKKSSERVLKGIVIFLILVLFAAQATYVVSIRDRWDYPVEYKWGKRIKSMTSPDEGVLVIPGTGIHSYSSTFYSERRVELVWNLDDLITKLQSPNRYRYFIANDALFKNPKYSELACYLFSHYNSTFVDGMYVFDLHSTSDIVFSLNRTVDFDRKIRLINMSMVRIGGLNNSMVVCYIWLPLAPIKQDYTVFVHFVKNNSIEFQQDHPPCAGKCPTSTWQMGTPVMEVYLLKVPSNGCYELYLGVWSPDTGKRLPVNCVCNDGNTRAFLGDVCFTG